MKEFFNSIGNWFENNWRPIVTVVAIAVIGFILVKLILALVKRQLGKTKLDKALQGFVLSILKFVLYLILIFSIISSLGISITGLTVVATALSLAISLALQDSLKNLVNGFIVISTGLLKQGDWVKVAGVEGSVIDVKMLFTVLKTGDNKKITIPNSTILSSEVINYNTLKSRRVDMDFTIAYNSNVDLAKKVINEVLDSCEMVYTDPAPSVVLSNLGESALTITVKVWCSSDDYWDTKWYVIDHVFNELKR
ncbi:MAG: mechanosensitive ion channel family protein, partial [Clostridia bacterium]|nr:mechanosensitive ion channel family protein [Clostridia bacterium]